MKKHCALQQQASFLVEFSSITKVSFSGRLEDVLVRKINLLGFFQFFPNVLETKVENICNMPVQLANQNIHSAIHSIDLQTSD